ncbi:putative protein kinase RLK-Pelle-LRR-III family [Helianthus debilis subsp. tardiflorus]
MSSLLVFVFSVLILHYVPVSCGGAYDQLGESTTTCGVNCQSTYTYTYTYSERRTTTTSSVPQLNTEEKQALLSFINKVHHSGSLSWTDSIPACSWEGVTCSPGGTTVLYLRLPHKNLTGEIPSNTIGILTSLRVLSLDHNTLSGEIPSDFSKLNFLTTLYLNNNSFSGYIPSSFSKLSYLTSFSVSYNKLAGQIPPSLSKFPLSSFSNNPNLCGPPLSSCNNSPSQSPLPPPKRDNTSDGEGDNTSTPKRRAIFGIFSGSTMLLLIFFGSVGKNMYQYIRPTSENKKLVKFGDDDFVLEDLLKTPVKDLSKTTVEDLSKTTVEDLSKKLVKFGGGSAGTSYKQELGKNKTVVLKILKDVVVTEEEFKATMEVLGKIKNRSVVPLRAFFDYSNNEKWLVYDYMTAGSLSARLHGSVQTQFNWDHRVQIALSAAKGLAYLHEVDIVHGNITSSNIFFQQETNNEVSLSDYGLNKLFHGSRSSLNRRVTGYWAPEVLRTRVFTFESDVYSFGVLLLELLTRKIPNHASLEKEGDHFSDWVGSIVCEEPKVELFDVELTRDQKTDKMVQLLRIAEHCVQIVPNQRPPMCRVVSMMEDMLSRQSSDYNSKGYNNSPSSMELVIH